MATQVYAIDLIYVPLISSVEVISTPTPFPPTSTPIPPTSTPTFPTPTRTPVHPSVYYKVFGEVCDDIPYMSIETMQFSYNTDGHYFCHDTSMQIVFDEFDTWTVLEDGTCAVEYGREYCKYAYDHVSLVIGLPLSYANDPERKEEITSFLIDFVEGLVR